MILKVKCWMYDSCDLEPVIIFEHITESKADLWNIFKIEHVYNTPNRVPRPTKSVIIRFLFSVCYLKTSIQWINLTQHSRDRLIILTSITYHTVVTDGIAQKQTFLLLWWLYQWLKRSWMLSEYAYSNLYFKHWE